ncbi:hypothetical protein B296_00050503 [Ensete ventricosum]|uniref:Large ribosomal subunit protein uL15/eL18 domain-containing protein n=1 Tax=Ensete ventricosum TaxID=4639 RepID=A0A426XDQ1_ENSVE|nr:hypothetical protein B296_00050503 [Ensete ventricosum]
MGLLTMVRKPTLRRSSLLLSSSSSNSADPILFDVHGRVSISLPAAGARRPAAPPPNPMMSTSIYSWSSAWLHDKIAVIVGTVTDDKRVYDVPALKVTALKFTETILKSGEECLTFHQLSLRAPLGQNMVLVTSYFLVRSVWK